MPTVDYNYYGQSSIELHLRLHVVDIQDCLAGISPYSLHDVIESLERLVKVRIVGKLSHFDQPMIKRLVNALLRVTKMRKGGFLSRAPVEESQIAFRVFSLLLQEVVEFQSCVDEIASEDLIHRLQLESRMKGDAEESILVSGVAIISSLRSLFPLKYSSLDAIVDEDDVPFFENLIEKYGAETPVAHTARMFPAQGAYYSSSVEKLPQLMRTDLKNGLTEAEVKQRQEFYGANSLPSPPAPSVLEILFKQIRDFMVLLLIAASIASFATMEIESGIVLLVVIVMNVAIGFVQEYKALKTLSQIMTLSVPNAEVIRDSKRQTVLAAELVPGDLVVLEEGARVPADLRLVEVSELDTIEGVLTGESMPVRKHTDAIKGKSKNIAVGDRTNLAFLSTMVARGRGQGIVVATGVQSEAGKISANLAEGGGYQKTPLQKKLAKLGMWLVVVAVILCALVVIVGIANGGHAAEMIKIGVSLAISAIPEGLVAVSTVVMSLGVKRMAQRNAIVRQLPSVETLGSCTYICSDKTGTLTEGQMSVEQLQTSMNKYDFDRRADVPFKDHDVKKLPKDLLLLLMTSRICNNASFSVTDGVEEQHGDPTEVALIVPSHVSGIDWNELERVKEFPFDSTRKRMSVIVKGESTSIPYPSFFGDRFVLMKGAPEAVLKCCSSIATPDGDEWHLDDDIIGHSAQLQEQSSTMAACGLRVLAMAGRSLSLDDSVDSDKDVERGCTFFGLVGMMDPPRSTSLASIEQCHKAGIEVVMITGDHALTASAIARRLGIQSMPPGPPQGIDTDEMHKHVLRGDEVDVFTPEDLQRLEPFPSVFARVNPDTKQKVVKALQGRGEVVAMCGDGVNDAPAIKLAEIGVAMGISGTELAKQVADIILMDDRFDTIVVAVKEGRRVFDNLFKFCIYLLSCNSSEIIAFLIASAVGLGNGIIFTPIMILFANVFADVPEAIALGLEPAEDDVMDRPPRPPKMGILTLSSSSFIVLQGLVMAAITLVQFWFQIVTFPNVHMEKHRTVAFVQLALMHLIHAFNCKIPLASIFRINVLSNRWLLVGFALSISLLFAGLYIPGLNGVLDLIPIGGLDWAAVMVGIAAYFVVVEILKLVMRLVRDAHGKRRRRNAEGDDIELSSRV